MKETTHAVLLGDIGGTNARFALCDAGELTPVQSIPTADFANFRDAVSHALGRMRSAHPVAAAILAVAGPIESGRCILINSSWVIDAADLRQAFGLDDVRLLNDFEAIAWALPHLTAADLRPIGGGQPERAKPVVVLGPGTGLGLACLPNGPDSAMVIASEGGHATLPSSSAREDVVIAWLRARFGHVSAERALSGPGLENLYAAIRSIDRMAAPDRTAMEITSAATKGTCPVSAAALDMFCEMLGTTAGDMALTFGARGGVFIAGGIAPRIVDYLARSRFRARFEAKGRLQSYLGAIPTNVILRSDPAFVGLRALAERQAGAKRNRL